LLLYDILYAIFSPQINKFHTYLKSLAFDNIDKYFICSITMDKSSLLIMKMAQKICVFTGTHSDGKSGLIHGKTHSCLIQTFIIKANFKLKRKYDL